MWLEAGMVIAMSGTTIAGLLLEVAPAWTAPAGTAEADRTMPPLINATAGRDAQIFRIGKVIVRTRRTLGMTLPGRTPRLDEDGGGVNARNPNVSSSSPDEHQLDFSARRRPNRVQAHYPTTNS